LPNHYHLLLQTPDLKAVLTNLRHLHGRTSFEWNRAECREGRRVWCSPAETIIESEGHFYAALNYLLNNPVRHGYVLRWQDWPFSNASEYLDAVGRQEAAKRWRLYPILDFGAAWDPPEL
jgi:putative transposase